MLAQCWIVEDPVINGAKDLRVRNRTILQVVPRLGSGGAERTTVEMAQAIVADGGRAIVVTAGGRLAEQVVRSGGEIILMPVHRKDPVSILANAGRLERIIKERDVDLVHARSRGPAWSAGMAARRRDVPFVTTFHGAHEASNALKRWYNSALVKSDLVIANSRYTADRIRKNYNIGDERIRIIPRGANLDWFDPGAVMPERVEKATADWMEGAPSDAFRILLPARLTAWKGQELSIDALALLTNRALKSQDKAGKIASLRLVICGGAQDRGDFERRLRARITERGVREMVKLVGEIADMPAAYVWADVVLAPSLTPEPFGRTAVEAGAMGVPVVAAAHGGAIETLVDGVTGILFEPGSAAALANALGALEATPHDQRRAMGEAAQARVRAIYSSRAMCDATLKIYGELEDCGARQ